MGTAYCSNRGAKHNPRQADATEPIGQSFNLGCADDVDPGPVLLENMQPEELHAIAVDFNRAPGVRIDQLGEIHFELLHGELIRAAIVISSDPPHSAGIDIDDALAEAA